MMLLPLNSPYRYQRTREKQGCVIQMCWPKLEIIPAFWERVASSCIDILESQQGADESLSGGLVHMHTLPFEVTVTAIITVH